MAKDMTAGNPAKLIFTFAMCFSVLGTLGAYTLGEYALQLFVTAEDVAVIEAAMHYLRIVTLMFPFATLLFILTSTLHGLGNAVIPMFCGFTELGIRMIASLVLARPEVLGYTGVCLATPLAWVGAVTILIIFYHRDMNRLDREAKKADTETVHLQEAT